MGYLMVMGNIYQKKVEKNIRENLKKEKEMEMEFVHFQTKKVIAAIGKIIKEMVKENIHFQMEIIIKGNLKKICLMDKGS